MRYNLVHLVTCTCTYFLVLVLRGYFFIDHNIFCLVSYIVVMEHYCRLLFYCVRFYHLQYIIRNTIYYCNTYALLLIYQWRNIVNSLSTKNSNQFWGFGLLLLKFFFVEQQPASTAYSYYQRKIYGITGRICNIQKFEIGYFYLAIRTNYSQEWSTIPTTITVTKSGSRHNKILTHSSGKTTLLVQWHLQRTFRMMSGSGLPKSLPMNVLQP